MQLESALEALTTSSVPRADLAEQEQQRARAEEALQASQQQLATAQAEHQQQLNTAREGFQQALSEAAQAAQAEADALRAQASHEGGAGAVQSMACMLTPGQQSKLPVPHGSHITSPPPPCWREPYSAPSAH